MNCNEKYLKDNKDLDAATVSTLPAGPYSLRGAVVSGKGLGRRSGMPTANLQITPEMLIPKQGVYATITRIENDGKKYYGLTHIGVRPSVDESPEVTVETYLFDFTGDLYSKVIETEFHLYIRETRKFESLDEVKAQVDADAQTAKKYFNCVY